MNATSFATLLKNAAFSVRAAVNEAPWMDFGDAIQGPDSCVYLIFNPSGELLYVGETHSVATRLRHHPRPSGHLFNLIARERALKTKNVLGHRCECGRKHPCVFGEVLEDNRQRAASLGREIWDTYRVKLIAGTFEEFGGRKIVENFMQWLLLPRYGVWTDSTARTDMRWHRIQKEGDKDGIYGRPPQWRRSEVRPSAEALGMTPKE